MQVKSIAREDGGKEMKWNTMKKKVKEEEEGEKKREGMDLLNMHSENCRDG